MRTSFLEILPRSPCDESPADKLNAGQPVEESVAAIFDAIKPLFPTPHRIIFDWQFAIWITASLNELLILFFNFCSALISKLITSLAIDINFLLKDLLI